MPEIRNLLITMTMFLAICVALVSSMAGCSDDPEMLNIGADAGADAGDDCVAGELPLDGGGCQPAGLPTDMPCPPGHIDAGGGACQPAGVPPGACGAGFVPDGKNGCEPVLPADACPTGTMANPGDAQCHPIAACGKGDYGDIPVEANTQFVNAAYAGDNGPSNGTASRPWTKIQDGIDAAATGAIVAVAAGAYDEPLYIGPPNSGRVRLWGRCPSLVEVGNTNPNYATLLLQGGVDGTEIHDLALTGAWYGLFTSGSDDVLLDEVWIHDTGGDSLVVQDSLGLTSLVVQASLIEAKGGNGVFVGGSKVSFGGSSVRGVPASLSNRAIHAQDNPETGKHAEVAIQGCVVERAGEVAVFAQGSDLSLVNSVVRGAPSPQGVSSVRGVLVRDDPMTKERSLLVVHGSVLVDNGDASLVVAGSDAAIDATVVRDTLVNGSGTNGRGIDVQLGPGTGARASVTIESSVVERNHNVGVFVEGSNAGLRGVVVRDTVPDGSGLSGRGLGAQYELGKKQRAVVSISGCLFERNTQEGVFAGGSDLDVEATLVRDTRLTDDGRFGHGIGIQDIPGKHVRSSATIRSTIVEQSHIGGIHVSGSDATIEASIVRDTKPNSDGRHGRGINIQDTESTGERAGVTLLAVAVEQSHEVGISVSGSDAIIRGSIVEGTLPQASDSTLGDGIAVLSLGVHAAAEIAYTRSSSSARAGASNFGARVTAGSNWLECNMIDLDGEDLGNFMFEYVNLGGNSCGCPVADQECKVVTANIAPPDRLEESP